MSEPNSIQVTLPDGKVVPAASGSTPLDIASGIGKGLAKAAIGARVDGQLVDVTRPLTADCVLEIVTLKSKGAEEIFRHTMTHIMAAAVKRLHPGTALGVGPVIENGFYYDFGLPSAITEEELEKIAREMEKIIAEDSPVIREELSRDAARALMEKEGEPLKVELIDGFGDPRVSFYRMGDFVDMCRGPHLPRTGVLKHFKLLSVAGAYWKGDAKNRQLQRVYGTAFASKEELQAHIDFLEEARKRDHRKIGKEMDLFSFHLEGPGFPFFHPKGTLLYQTLLDFWRAEHRKRGYVEVTTPLVLNEQLWHRSGHWDNYKENMYFVDIEGEGYAIKPMNCPGHCLIYKNRGHSYRDLPIRMMEPGRVHRHELSGVMHGLFRVRTFAIDDAHIYCAPDQIQDEVLGVIELILSTYRTFGFSGFRIELSTRPAKRVGTDEMWDKAEAALEQALVLARDKVKADLGMELPEHAINPGDGAFYGPKIDFHIKDCIGRTWQCGTVQLDFSMPERFDLEFVGSDNAKHRPVMIHRAAFGSFERFLGILIEHYAGKFPLWLAPVQALVMTVTSDQNEYGREVGKALRELGVRVEEDLRNEKIGYKIREGQLARVPLMIVLGKAEAEKRSLTVRLGNGRNIGDLNLDTFMEQVFRKHFREVPQ
ncbi:MAG: threonine--tRNA ligase [Candidatus Wallbacteria bacterium]|nr:threonine--tRNA ligase [Candidatus Wallbacteria bacterium]